jgi:chemotaxis protein CheZ
MAQDFQDLTGQVIRRVIGLVQEVQDSLVNMIRISGGTAVRTAARRPGGIDAEGPQVLADAGGVAVVKGQDEVDDLLSSLGF